MACAAGRIALFIKIRKTGEKPVWGKIKSLILDIVKSETPFTDPDRSQTGS